MYNANYFKNKLNPIKICALLCIMCMVIAIACAFGNNQEVNAVSVPSYTTLTGNIDEGEVVSGGTYAYTTNNSATRVSITLNITSDSGSADVFLKDIKLGGPYASCLAFTHTTTGDFTINLYFDGDVDCESGNWSGVTLGTGSESDKVAKNVTVKVGSLSSANVSISCGECTPFRIFTNSSGNYELMSGMSGQIGTTETSKTSFSTTTQFTDVVLTGTKAYFDFSPSISTYSMTYNENGATSGSVPTDSSKYASGAGHTVLGKSTLVKTGCDFTGWNTQADGLGTHYAVGSTYTFGSSNATLYAEWKPYYSITYLGNGNTSGTVPTNETNKFYNGASTTVLSGESLVKENYEFTGWNTQADGLGTHYAVGSTYTFGASNATLYAEWKAYYTITYFGNGNTSGTVPTYETNKFYNGASATVLSGESLVKENYEFAGWNTLQNGSGTNYSANSNISINNANIELYAKWNQVKFAVNYNLNGGSGANFSTEYKVPNTIISITNIIPTKTNYRFAGWNTLQNGLGSSYAYGDGFQITSSDQTLYAQWNPEYTVSYDANGGTGTLPNETKFIENQAFTIANAEGLTNGTLVFAGWNTLATGLGTDYAPNEVVNTASSNIELFAKWTDANPFTSTITKISEFTYGTTYNGVFSVALSSEGNSTYTAYGNYGVNVYSDVLCNNRLTSVQASNNVAGVGYTVNVKYALAANTAYYLKAYNGSIINESANSEAFSFTTPQNYSVSNGNTNGYFGNGNGIAFNSKSNSLLDVQGAGGVKITYSNRGWTAQTSSGLSVWIVPRIVMGVSGTDYIVLDFYARNNTSTAITDGKVGASSDVMIGSNDRAPIYRKPYGFLMTNGSTQNFALVGVHASEGIASEVDTVSTIWFGHYGLASSNCFANIASESLTGVDSGASFSWQNLSIDSGETIVRSVAIGVASSSLITEDIVSPVNGSSDPSGGFDDSYDPLDSTAGEEVVNVLSEAWANVTTLYNYSYGTNAKLLFSVETMGWSETPSSYGLLIKPFGGIATEVESTTKAGSGTNYSYTVETTLACNTQISVTPYYYFGFSRYVVENACVNLTTDTAKVEVNPTSSYQSSKKYYASSENDIGYYINGTNIDILGAGAKQTTYYYNGWNVIEDNGANVSVWVSPQFYIGESGKTYVRMTYTVRNISNSTVTGYKLGVHADTMIGSNDYSPIYKTPYGLMLSQRDLETYPDALSFAIITNGATVTDGLASLVNTVNSSWFGWYYNRTSSVFANTASTALTGADSGASFSWQGISLNAGETKQYSVLFGVTGAECIPSDLGITDENGEIPENIEDILIPPTQIEDTENPGEYIEPTVEEEQLLTVTQQQLDAVTITAHTKNSITIAVKETSNGTSGFSYDIYNSATNEIVYSFSYTGTGDSTHTFSNLSSGNTYYITARKTAEFDPVNDTTVYIRSNPTSQWLEYNITDSSNTYNSETEKYELDDGEEISILQDGYTLTIQGSANGKVYVSNPRLSTEGYPIFDIEAVANENFYFTTWTATPSALFGADGISATTSSTFVIGNQTFATVAPSFVALTEGTGSVSCSGWNYNSYNASSISVTNKTADYLAPTIEYSTDNGTTWSTTTPTNAGTYLIRGKFARTEKYFEHISTASSFTISKINGTGSIACSGWTFGDEYSASVMTISGKTAEYQTPTFEFSSDNGATWSETAPTDAGSYKVRANFSTTTNYFARTSDAVTFTIDKLAVKAPSIKGSYVYNKTAQTVLYNDFDSALMTASGNISATNFGNYSVSIALNNTANYKWATEFNGTLNWNIQKATFDMSSAKWNYVSAFVEDGTQKTVTVTGLPTGVTATYANNVKTAFGKYTATATLIYDTANYNVISIDNLVWTIRQASVCNISIPEDNSVPSDIIIEKKNGIDPEAEIKITPTERKASDFSEELTWKEGVKNSFDASLIVDGIKQNGTGDFTVKFNYDAPDGDLKVLVVNKDKSVITKTATVSNGVATLKLNELGEIVIIGKISANQCSIHWFSLVILFAFLAFFFVWAFVFKHTKLDLVSFIICVAFAIATIIFTCFSACPVCITITVINWIALIAVVIIWLFLNVIKGKETPNQIKQNILSIFGVKADETAAAAVSTNPVVSSSTEQKLNNEASLSDIFKATQTIKPKRSAIKMSKKKILEGLRTQFPNGAIVTKEHPNITSTGLPLADTIYTKKGVCGSKIGEVCFAYIYQLNNGGMCMLVRISAESAENIMKEHPKTIRSRFPKNGTWFSVIIDDTFTDEKQVFDILASAKANCEKK